MGWGGNSGVGKRGRAYAGLAGDKLPNRLCRAPHSCVG